jgi:hypothetical protein
MLQENVYRRSSRRMNCRFRYADRSLTAPAQDYTEDERNSFLLNVLVYTVS